MELMLPRPPRYLHPMSEIAVATFNVHHCAGLDDRVDIGRTADVIRKTGATIVALQELDRGMKRSGEVDQPAELSRELGMSVVFQSTLERGKGSYGIGLASRDDLPWDGHQLPRMGDEE